MSEYTMEDSGWRTVQLFLIKTGVAEVSINTGPTKSVHCTCPVFEKSKRCKHQKYVKAQIMENDGNFTINIPYEVDEDLMQMAIEDKELFRQFIIEYGKVEVID